MGFGLLKLDEDTLYEHLFDRYVGLERNVDELKQDLGIQERSSTRIEIDFEPPVLQEVELTKEKKGTSRKKKSRSKTEGERYNLVIEQSITDLKSTVSNNNSTTGYVLWSSTPFFINWLLYNEGALPFREGSDVTVLGSFSELDDAKNTISIPSLYSKEKKVGILELGTGISPLLSVILANHVDEYVCTDQRGILNKLKSNIRENLSEINKRECISKTLNISNEYEEEENKSSTIADINENKIIHRKNKSSVCIEVEELDWEKFSSKVPHPYLERLSNENDTVYIIAMDVIYNEYLIEPFLQTLSQLRKHFINASTEVRCIIGIHLRSQDITTQFLEHAITQQKLQLYHVVDSTIEGSRFAFYYI